MTEQTGNNKPNEAEALAFPLSGNEKLIEKAAAQRYPHRNVFLEGMAYMSEEKSRVPLREAFVEGAKWHAGKALTPTDDESEALARVKRDLVEAEREGGDAWVTPADLRMLLDGFRRSEAESSAERIGCNICGEALPDGEPHLCSEPQGEPSEGVIRNHGGWDMELQSKPYPSGGAVDAALAAWNATGGSDRVAMRAALRAAGGVR